MYFDFYKENNPLYRDITLNTEQIDEFENKSMKTTDEFLETSRESESKQNSDEESNIFDSGSDSNDDIGEDFDMEEDYQDDEKENEVHCFRDESTLFSNKYEEDVSAPTVANKLANIIVDIEISKGIDSELYEADKADVNDEINLEEIDQFLSSMENPTSENVDLKG